MKFSRLFKLAALSTIAMIGLSGCATNERDMTVDDNPSQPSASVSGAFVGAGASSQGEAQNAWIASIIDSHPDLEITYDPAGSGAGRENFQQGASQFAGSDRAYTVEEIAEGQFSTCSAESKLVELPLYISPIAVIFNLEGVDSLNLDADTLANIFLGEITVWNDPIITSQNSGIDLPNTPITAVHRSDKSGTTGNFTDYLAAAAEDVWSFGSVEEWPLDSGEAALQTSGVVGAVSHGEGTIGYADASRANSLTTVKVKVGEEYVSYTPEAAAAIVDASPFEEGRSATDLAISLDRKTTESGVYPIVLISYLIGCETYADPAVAELVKTYLTYITSETGQQVAAEHAGSAPISSDLRSKIEAAISSIN